MSLAMNDQAREALGKVIGTAICNTPRSCELFIRQACGPFPEESQALIAALRQGVTDDLFEYQPERREWDEFSTSLRSRLQSNAGLGETEGSWAVDSWARVLGKHPENWQPSSSHLPRPMSEDDFKNKPGSDRALKAVMTTIVALGGGIGGALGAVLVPAATLLTSAYVEMPMMSSPVRHSSPNSVWVIVIIVLFVLGLIGSIGGAIGGALGWLHGRGDQGHWTAFSTACGGAFASGALGSYFCGIFGSFFGAALGAFGAATHSARRGGYS
jgi:hypothetical protein